MYPNPTENIRMDTEYRGSTFAEPDLSVINELIEHIERSHSMLDARILLMQQYARCGWTDAAEEVAHEALKIESSNSEAQIILAERRKQKRQKRQRGSGHKEPIEPHDRKEAKERKAVKPPWKPARVAVTDPSTSLRTLESGYVKLLKDAESLLGEMKRYKTLDTPILDKEKSDLAGITLGKVSRVVRVKPLDGLDAVAQAIIRDCQTSGSKGLDIAIDDLQKAFSWVGTSANTTEHFKISSKRPASTDDDGEAREALLKRAKGLKALLPLDLHSLADAAIMHAEHELLHRTYVNDKTMLRGEPISDIPRANFWASEDGYAWDMEELAGALRSGDGVMRNPLTKEMFSKSDVRAIVQHPLGRGLQALQLEQSSLKQGVRPHTVKQIAKLANVLKLDVSENGRPSRLAVEEIVSYLQTLPESEQKAIERLRVPAKDSHSGMPFDTTIGEAVADMQGNRVCSHCDGRFSRTSRKVSGVDCGKARSLISVV